MQSHTLPLSANIWYGQLFSNPLLYSASIVNCGNGGDQIDIVYFKCVMHPGPSSGITTLLRWSQHFSANPLYGWSHLLIYNSKGSICYFSRLPSRNLITNSYHPRSLKKKKPPLFIPGAVAVYYVGGYPAFNGYSLGANFRQKLYHKLAIVSEKR